MLKIKKIMKTVLETISVILNIKKGYRKTMKKTHLIILSLF